MDNKNLKDHKQIGQELELFFTNDIAPGAPFWLPKGMVIFKELEKYIRQLTEKAGYLETSTPIMVKNQLFKDSGHWEKFGQGNIYSLSIWEGDERIKLYELIVNSREFKEKAEKYKKENILMANDQIRIEWHDPDLNQDTEFTVDVSFIDGALYPIQLPPNYSLKPMNCPESTILYRFKRRSYRELPLRLSEIGRLHRREKSGEVNGLLRVRQLTMDDAHIYATEDQIFDEVSNILDMMTKFYKSFGFEYDFRLATRPEVRAGSDENWDKAELALEKVIREKALKASDKKGDGAFYGPKIDVHIKDSQGREWQLATVQLDFHQPEAFQLEYVDEKGDKLRPVMIHRAIFGSFERFIAILTEHFQGAFPLWLSPIQVQIIPIADRHQRYGQKVLEQLKTSSIRVELDSRAETMQAKIRDAQTQKIPYMVVVGDREEKEEKIAVRTKAGQDLGALRIEEFLERIKSDIESKL